VSQVPIINETALREAIPIDQGNPENEALSSYLSLPATVPDRVKELAREITKNATNPYDQAKSLEQYLSTNFKYNSKPDVSKGKSKDFVDSFLFEIKEGYCDYFSTAMAVMARSIGLPSRWVKGYTSGEAFIEGYDFRTGMPPDFLEDLDGPASYTVRNSDAHSWVEIYFDGFGWIAFEPTSGFSMPVALPNEEVELPDSTDTNKAFAAAEDEKFSVWPMVTLMLSILCGIAVIAACIYYFRKPIVNRLPKWVYKKANGPNQRIVIEFENYLKFAKRKGYHRREHETMRETVIRWSRDYKWLSEDLQVILSVFEKAKYSARRITDDELQLGLLKIAKLREEMK
jgi:hypothetical protein